ncbi:MAG TPA: hypothetical protein VIT67_10060 [Povalibacter sp.]
MYEKQYVISRGDANLPASYRRCRIGEWHIGVASDLDVLPLPLSGDRVGYLIGHPVDFEGVLRAPIENDFENALYKIAGSYVAIVQADNDIRLYLDACGSLPAVYCPAHGIVAANVDLIAAVPYSRQLQRQFPIDANMFFPFTLTPKGGVHRLLPNHFLSLSTWIAERHWPKVLTEGTRSPDQNIDLIISRLTGMLSLLVTEHPISLPLTAGYDSRALLASLTTLNAKGDITYFTSLIDKAGVEDAEIAGKIAEELGLRYRKAQFVDPTEQERDHWLASTGRSVGGRASYNFKTIAREVNDRVTCMGLAGEVGRTFYGAGIEKKTPLSAGLLLKKLGLPLTELSDRDAQHWLAEFAGFNSQQIMDFLYIEIRLGCWAGPQMIADAPARFRTIPFNQRPIFECMLDTPFALRSRQYIPTSIVRRLTPKLIQYPYNPGKRGSLWRRGARLVHRMIETRVG